MSLLRFLNPYAWLAALGFAGVLWGLHVWGTHVARGEGRAEIQAKWDQAERERDEAIADAKREAARIARQAEAEYAATRADRIRRQAEVADALRKALQRPVSCPADGALPLADVVLPAAAVDRLRAAAADHPASGPAAAGSGR